MDSILSPLPEFYCLGHNLVTSPERGEGDLSGRELSFHLIPLELEQFPRRDDLALRGSPGSDLASFGPTLEILERFSGRDFLGLPGDNHLSLEGKPREEERDLGIFPDMLRLATFVVGKKEKALGAKAFEEHGSIPRLTLGIDGSEAHGVRF